jgi:hypothetical protein
MVAPLGSKGQRVLIAVNAFQTLGLCLHLGEEVPFIATALGIETDRTRTPSIVDQESDQEYHRLEIRFEKLENSLCSSLGRHPKMNLILPHEESRRAHQSLLFEELRESDPRL